MSTRLSQSLKRFKKDQINSLVLPFTPRVSAVLALIHFNKKQSSIMFTQRSEEVGSHKGQVCFPGGMVEEVDRNLWDTAVRETHEEVGISSQHITYIGELGKVVTPTGFEITPFVGGISNQTPFQINPYEITQAFWIPLSHLLNKAHFVLEKKVYDGIEYDDPVFRYKNYKIWGATGRILRALLDSWRDAFLFTSKV